MSTGERIKKARKKAGLTQRELGERIGVSGSMIGQYETGARNAKIETLDRIAEALNIDPFDLMAISVTFNSPSGFSYPERDNWDDVVNDIKTDIRAQIEKKMLDEQLVKALVSLDEDDVQRVLDFIAGLKAQRGHRNKQTKEEE